MSLKDLDLNLITKLATQQIDHVTCLECCKYYIAPETARCGHALCHTCWRGRRSCPVCSASVERRTLKPNLPLQMLTDHIHSFGDAFEKLFQIKLDEFVLEIPQESESDTNKNVKQWLASSDNQFSAPLTSQTSQDSMPPIQVTTSKIQVHTDTTKPTSPNKLIHKVQPQDDWDKIEVLPETEEIDIRDKNKENIIGPMDIEPFVFEDEYSTDHPRRSSRKRDNNFETITKESEMNNGKNSTVDSEKKSSKVQQNWGNVKKMRKEFSKLNKKNKSKLNVSIEMVKKAQKMNEKPVHPTTHIDSQAPVYTIEDNTPTVCESEEYTNVKENTEGEHETDKNNVGVLSNAEKVTKKATVLQSQVFKSLKTDHQINTEKVTKKAPELQSQVFKSLKTDHQINTEKVTKKAPELQSQVLKSLKNDRQLTDIDKSNSKVVAMPIIKKGALCDDARPRLPEEAFTSPSKPADVNQPVTVNTDDIEITIKIGNTITNIVINKKKNDVQLKVNTDREIQTSLGAQNLQNKESKSCSTSTEPPMQNLEINIGSNTFTQSKATSESAEKDETKVNGSKSTSTKVTKNTASADTATVQFEITESVEREISNIMECVENEDNTAHEPHTVIVEEKEISINPESEAKNNTDAEEMDVEDNINDQENNVNNIELLNEQDIFASGSVKDLPLQMLKATKNTPSEIFVSRPKTQRQEKRVREESEEETQSRKKYKNSQEKPRNVDVSKDATLQDSEGMNYDAVMGKVFASIDADIEIIQKSQNTVKHTQVLETTQKSNESALGQTQKPNLNQSNSKKLNLSRAKTQEKVNSNDKYSENLFTNFDKDSEPQDAKIRTGSKKDPGPETQRNIDNLLTPGVCDNFESTRNEVIIADDDIEVVMATPVVEDDHDYDDVVEETQQKNMSYTKKSVHKSDNSNTKPTSIVQPQNTKSGASERSSKKPLSIINLTDSVVETKLNNETTVVDNNKKSTSETPLTINKFFDHITHKSTPVARKSLHFQNDSAVEDSERTLCPPSSQLVKNTQEQEFMINAFEKTQKSTANRKSPVMTTKKDVKYCLAGSCLTPTEIARVKKLCLERNWTYADKYTRELTHLVVGVDQDRKAQRSVKYMCSLAASKWIVAFQWVEQCLLTKQLVDEESFEALDMTGSAGPARSRRAPGRLFRGMSFYCMPPFSIVNVDDLKEMLISAGGRVVSEASSVRVTGSEPAILLAEPEHTQEDKFIYLAMELGIVPVNFEWVLNSLGDYSLHSIFELLLCPATLLPKATEQWPPELVARDNDSLTETE